MIRSLLYAILFAVPAWAEPVDQGPKNVPDFQPAWPNQTRAEAVSEGIDLAVDRIATGLVHPWGIAVLPQGGYLVTERSGQLRHITPDGQVSAPISGVPEVLNRGQGGLLDVALAPDFADSRMVYLTYAKPFSGGLSATAAARGVLSADRTALAQVEDIFVQSPPSPTPAHYGSRIVFDDQYAFITTGEHSSRAERVFAQDIDKTYGKVVRLRLDGGVPSDNPFVGQGGAADVVWTLGHRNVQGAAFHPDTGALWTLEHGPRGGDELNLIARGTNYGWPVVTYGREYRGPLIGDGQPRADGLVEPQYYWDPVIAPGGFTFYQGQMFAEWDGDILAGSLNPGGVVRLVLDGNRVTGEERLLTRQGRIRDVDIDHDGALLVLVDRDNGALLRVSRN